MAGNPKNIKKVLILGSGALKIGEAGEFDYSGSQAIKAIKEEGIHTVLINPNIATIQTSSNLADTIYFLPVSPFFVEKVIAREKPDGILLGFGGQTALNCGMRLAGKGVFKKYHVEILGTPISAIEKSEDRLEFRKFIESLGLKVPKSITVNSVTQLQETNFKMDYPVIVRAGYSLGGLGSGVAYNKKQLQELARKALMLSPQILIEEYLEHWKEIEYEVVRDRLDNTITVCNMENFDPMGIHTGESMVVAPSQTLTNDEYHKLRRLAIKVIKALPIIGECNIQYALDPRTGDYRIIEVNARLSRSSALASKATGYPLAYIAAKLALGYSLSQLSNKVTQATCAFFEPALDYVVVKIPRWDFLKFKNMGQLLGSEMQSVGEVMAIGRSFTEALQKAVRSLDLGYEGIISDELNSNCSEKHKNNVEFRSLLPTPERPYNIAYNLYHGQSISDIYNISGIDKWFLDQIKEIIDMYKELLCLGNLSKLTPVKILSAKKSGFSDAQIAKIFKVSCLAVRNLRLRHKITPKICQIDTLAGEFPAKTNYLYLSYHRTEHDILKTTKNQIGVIGGGPYQIGSSVEFDWCAVTAVLTAKKMGYQTIMINCNPETVSTDYDIPDKLYFEELTQERILDIVDFEKCPLIVSVGGQIPNTLALKLASLGIKILGTAPKSIDAAEDREKFSALLDKLNIKQPLWKRLTTKKEALAFARTMGYPVLVRPSYVLSGRAMFVAYSHSQLASYLDTSEVDITSEYPLVVSKFIRGATEVDFDSVAQNGHIKVYAISEHVEHSGVHSGDATLVLPSFSLSTTAKKQIFQISEKIAGSLSVNGPFNIQYLVRENGDHVPEVMVIEANLRASRSFPFVSKVLGINFITLATKIMLGKSVSKVKLKLPSYFGVKYPHFSFTRLRSADPVLRVEMASTGEVACFGDDLYEAYLKAVLSTGLPFPKKAALLSLGGVEGKQRLLTSARILHDRGFKLYATVGTTKFLNEHNIPAKFVYKVHENGKPNTVEVIKTRKVDLVINLSDRRDLAAREMKKQFSDGYLIRRAAVDANIPLFTKATNANMFVTALRDYPISKLKVKPWCQYIENKKGA